jgi:large subunit ribosomal protein L17
MRHRSAKIQVDRNAKQRVPLFRNLAISLITHEKITTTSAKARATKAMVERLITTAKPNTLHARRQIIKSLNNAKAADKLVKTIAPRFLKRQGGYIRSTKVGLRAGDAAEMMMLEIISE